MRILDTSLPRSPRRRKSNPPPEQLIQTFKAAALSVTNLYKTAAADQAQGRRAGYQDALDDVLAFLDQENLGLDDGEGWKVRQWATERLDGSPPAHAPSDSDEDRSEQVKRARSNSPVTATSRTANREMEPPRQISRSASPIRAASAPMAPPPPVERPQNTSTSPEIFSFRSAHPFPQDIDMQSDLSSNSAPQSDLGTQGQIGPSAPAVRVEMVPRGSRTPHRSSRHSSRVGPATRSLGSGVGSKRGFRFGDYEFDLGPGDGRDSFGGGGKRGRFT